MQLRARAVVPTRSSSSYLWALTADARYQPVYGTAKVALPQPWRRQAHLCR
jgi:hypothetical protein